MCWARKCCFCVKINLGTIMIAIGSLIIFTIVAVSSGVLLVLEYKKNEASKVAPNYFTTPHTLGILNNDAAINAILVTTLIVSVLAALFSVLLLIGIVKNKPGLVLSYFTFGTLATIVILLGCLLLLLHNYWYISLGWFIVSLIYIHFLVVVHTIYELMQSGQHFVFHRMDDSLEENLIN